MDKKNQQRQQQQKITKQAPAASYYHSIAKTKRFTFTVFDTVVVELFCYTIRLFRRVK
jgi:hypothetical protein